MNNIVDETSPGAAIKVLCYFGGFARMGGCEIFAANLLAGLKGKVRSRQIAFWETIPGELPVIQRIVDDGVSVVSSSFKKGCKFFWPDWVLFFRAHRALRSADVVVVVKLFTPRIHRALRRRVSAAGAKLIFITDYRPREKRFPLEILQTFDAICVQSPDFEQDLRNINYQGDVFVVPYLLAGGSKPIEPIPEPSPGGAVRIGFLGRLVADKNLPYLLQAFSELCRDEHLQRPCEMHLLGDGPDRNQLEQLAVRLGVSDMVKFHGLIQGPAVMDAIDSCHFFVLSSTTEGQCLAALEILSRGRPMVATAVGALPQILEDHRLGILAPLDSAKDYAAAMATMIRSIDARERTAETISNAFNERFGYQQTLERYLQVFRSQSPADIKP